jgi:hypothetical protein
LLGSAEFLEIAHFTAEGGVGGELSAVYASGEQPISATSKQITGGRALIYVIMSLSLVFNTAM